MATQEPASFSVAGGRVHREQKALTLKKKKKGMEQEWSDESARDFYLRTKENALGVLLSVLAFT